jgi:hypothetical protein
MNQVKSNLLDRAESVPQSWVFLWLLGWLLASLVNMVVRFEKTAASYEGLLELACGLIAFRREIFIKITPENPVLWTGMKRVSAKGRKKSKCVKYYSKRGKIIFPQNIFNITK